MNQVSLRSRYASTRRSKQFNKAVRVVWKSKSRHVA